MIEIDYDPPSRGSRISFTIWESDMENERLRDNVESLKKMATPVPGHTTQFVAQGRQSILEMINILVELL